MIRRILRKAFGKDMLWQCVQSLEKIELQNRVAMGMSRAVLTRDTAALDPQNPETWEFSGFSQHGEDGVIDFLIKQLNNKNEFFVEIGAADGTQNCTAWLAYVRQYCGLMIEGNAVVVAKAKMALQDLNWGVRFISSFVDQDNVKHLLKQCPYHDPDVFSLDIDGIDYYIAKAIFAGGFRPKIFIVEYNSAFGPDHAVTVPYRQTFSRFHEHPSGLYYGVSIAAWRRLFKEQGYEFISTEKSGTNAFFIDPAAFPAGFARRLQRVDFRMNYSDQNAATNPAPDEKGEMRVRRLDWKTQYEMIKDMPMVHVDSN
jgi:hypothetical protein